MDTVYQNAQKAHDDFFLCRPNDFDVNFKFGKFSDDFKEKKSPIEVDIRELNSRSRILLIRRIVQKIVDSQVSARKDQIFLVHYQFGEITFKCEHKTVKKKNVLQPVNIRLDAIGSYFDGNNSIEKRVERIAQKSSYSEIATKIQASRIKGIPIQRFDRLDQADAAYLNRFVFLLDLEVVRRLHREKYDKEPTNPFDHLPVGVAIAAATNLLRIPGNDFSLTKIGFYEAFAERQGWDDSVRLSYERWVDRAATKRSKVVMDAIWLYLKHRWNQRPVTLAENVPILKKLLVDEYDK